MVIWDLKSFVIQVVKLPRLQKIVDDAKFIIHKNKSYIANQNRFKQHVVKEIFALQPKITFNVLEKKIMSEKVTRECVHLLTTIDLKEIHV